MEAHSLQNVTAERLSPPGRAVRVAVTVVGAAVLLAGTIAGTDDDFPFGPFKMYSTTDKLDAPVADTRVDAVDVAGRPQVLDQGSTGIRRAEIEGQAAGFKADPGGLAVIARAYQAHRPSAPPLAEISVVVRWHQLRDGHPTGGYRDQVVAEWHR